MCQFENLLTFSYRVYRRDIGKAMRGANAKTRTEKVMLVLIESGLLYFLISVSNLMYLNIRI